MAFELEALVGHLYIVGGRAISSPPAGAYVEVAPQKARRGRETDTVFVLALGAGGQAAPAAFYTGLAELAAERYFESTGSVTAGMRTVFGLINDQLYDHNQRDPRRYEASLLIGVLRGTDIYIGRVGEAAAAYRHQGVVQAFPAPFSGGGVFSAPLGTQSIPDVSMSMFAIVPGSRLVFGDTALTAISMPRIEAALAAEDITAALIALKADVIGAASLMMIEFVIPEAPVSLPAREGETLKAALGSRPPAAPPPPVAEPAAEAAPVPRARRFENRTSTVERAAGAAALRAAGVVEGVNGVLDRVIPEAKGRERGWLHSPWALLVAVLLPVLVVAGVVGVWVNGTGESEFDRCVGEAARLAGVARGIASADVTGTVAAWNAVLLVTDRCETLREDDPQIMALRREARAITDQLLIVQRRELRLIDTLPSATLTQAVLQGEDLYVLDDANDLVYRVRISTEGFSLATGSRPEAIPAMRREGIVNQFTVGDIVDIAWADDGSGLGQGSVIVALDRSGVLIDCPPRFLQSCRAQALNTEVWVNPIAIQFWQGRLYVLDPSANQIWRYDPSGGAFPNAPSEYFVGEGRPDIRGAVDFAIDTPGSIYILLENGVLARFTGGRQEGFQFANFPDAQRMTRTNGFNLIPSPPRQGIYFADQSTRTVFETTMAGTFVAAYRGLDDDALIELAAVAVDTEKQIVYAVSGPNVFAFSRQP